MEATKVMFDTYKIKTKAVMLDNTTLVYHKKNEIINIHKDLKKILEPDEIITNIYIFDEFTGMGDYYFINSKALLWQELTTKDKHMALKCDCNPINSLIYIKNKETNTIQCISKEEGVEYNIKFLDL